MVWKYELFHMKTKAYLFYRVLCIAIGFCLNIFEWL